MLKKVFKLRGDYEQAKQEAVEKTVNALESKNNPLFFLLFLSMSVFCWLYALFILDGFEKQYNTFGFYPIICFFLTSYFALFSGSKFLFRPSQEELLDDTSIFAIFSACGRKELRSVISIGLSFLHTLVITLYLINKDLGFL